MCFASVSSPIFQHCPVVFISTPCSLGQGHILSPPCAYVGQIAVLIAGSLIAQYIFIALYKNLARGGSFCISPVFQCSLCKLGKYLKCLILIDVLLISRQILLYLEDRSDL